MPRGRRRASLAFTPLPVPSSRRPGSARTNRQRKFDRHVGLHGGTCHVPSHTSAYAIFGVCGAGSPALDVFPVEWIRHLAGGREAKIGVDRPPPKTRRDARITHRFDGKERVEAVQGYEGECCLSARRFRVKLPNPDSGFESSKGHVGPLFVVARIAKLTNLEITNLYGDLTADTEPLWGTGGNLYDAADLVTDCFCPRSGEPLWGAAQSGGHMARRGPRLPAAGGPADQSALSTSDA